MRLKFAGFVLAAAGLAAAQSALAADMPTKMAIKAPMVPVVNWTGFYGAIGGGYGMASTDSTLLTDPAGAFVANNGSKGGKGYLGTFQIGYDYQFLPAWVAGVFADYDVSDIKGSSGNALTLVNPWSQKSAWAAGGRIGYLVTPQILSYFNGGYTAARFTGGELTLAPTGAPAGASAGNQTFSGYFLGGGTEVTLGLLGPGWFMKSEYRYASYGSKTASITTDATGVTTGFAESNKPVVQSLSTALVYKFNGGSAASAMAAAPMVTKAPPAPAVNWTGFYGAIGGGYGMASTDSTLLTDPARTFLASNGSTSGKGYLGTFQTGYDYQFLPAWVAGVFADYDVSDIKGTLLDAATGVHPWSQKSAWAAGGRIGYLVTPQILSYFNGGYTAARFTGGELTSPVTGVPTGTSAGNQTFSGYFLGGGTEVTLGLLGPGWFMKSEYRYASYGSKTASITTDATGVTTGFAESNKPVVQSLSTALVYKFNGGR